MILRAARPEDATAVAEVCLRTAAAGQDATGRFSDDRLWADLYALPYLALEPDLAFVVADEDDRPVGYVVGTASTPHFARAFRERWLPLVADRYPEGPRADPGEAATVHTLHHPEEGWHAALEDYPAHLHVDLLPAAQGAGWGRALLTRFFAAVRDAGAPGVHLGVDPGNTRAVAFYEHLGFRRLPDLPEALLVAPASML